MQRHSYDAVLGVCLSAAILFTVLAGYAARHTQKAAVAALPARPPILIDAGHGGFDGGTVGCNGVPEKEINLAVALPLAAMLQLCGYPVQMTRTQDASLETQGTTIRARKVSDLQNRLAMADASLLTVSIHQNQFTVPKYSGAQMFYAPAVPGSAELAECIRAQIEALLQPENARRCMPGTKEVYLLHQATRPTVIVECGFLSNPEECEMLCRPDYQQQMAFAVLTGLMQYDP